MKLCTWSVFTVIFIGVNFLKLLYGYLFPLDKNFQTLNINWSPHLTSEYLAVTADKINNFCRAASRPMVISEIKKGLVHFGNASLREYLQDWVFEDSNKNKKIDPNLISLIRNTKTWTAQKILFTKILSKKVSFHILFSTIISLVLSQPPRFWESNICIKVSW